MVKHWYKTVIFHKHWTVNLKYVGNNSHTGKKPYKCSKCDKTFEQSTWNRQEITHTGEKNQPNLLHQCELCHVYFKLTFQMPGQILSSCIVFQQCELFNAYSKLTAQMSCHILSSCMVFHQCELIPAYFKLTLHCLWKITA